MSYQQNGRIYANKESARVALYHSRHRKSWYASRARSQKKYPEKVRARKAVQNKVRRGFMLPAWVQVCFDCKAPADVFDHYLGYSKKHRFAVQSICRACDSKRRYGKKTSKSRLVRRRTRRPS